MCEVGEVVLPGCLVAYGPWAYHPRLRAITAAMTYSCSSGGASGRHGRQHKPTRVFDVPEVA